MKPYTQAELEDFKAKYPRVVREIEVYPSGTTFDKDGTPSEEPACFLVKKPSKSLLSLINQQGVQRCSREDQRSGGEKLRSFG